MSEEQPHDSLFKEIFSVPEHAASHLRSVLPAELVARIDWATLALENTRLHISGLDATEDPKMPLRMLRYVIGVWSEYLKLHPATRTLPPVIPCVLHHGAAPWRSPIDVAAMVDVDAETRAALGPLIPSMQFLLDDLTALTAEQLDARTSSAAVRLTLHALHRFATTADPVGELRRLQNLNRELLSADSGPQALSSVLWYLLTVNDVDPQALEVVLDQTLGPPGTEALMAKMSTVQRMTTEAAEQGRHEGRQEGQAHSLVKLLAHRFKEPVPEPALARIRGASVAELDRWTERVLEAETLDDVLR